MRYNIILADPPWDYNDRGCQGAAERHYRTISRGDLGKLPIDQIAADDAVLFLWATYPTLPDALAVMEDWGFEYKTIGFQWLKQNLRQPTWFYGIGHWTRSNSEPCLIGFRGKIRPVNTSVSQLVITPRMKHSRKPAEVREKIVTMMGDLPRIELFATERVDGWDALGYDLDGRDIREVLEA